MSMPGGLAGWDLRTGLTDLIGALDLTQSGGALSGAGYAVGGNFQQCFSGDTTLLKVNPIVLCLRAQRNSVSAVTGPCFGVIGSGEDFGFDSSLGIGFQEASGMKWALSRNGTYAGGAGSVDVTPGVMQTVYAELRPNGAQLIVDGVVALTTPTAFATTFDALVNAVLGTANSNSDTTIELAAIGSAPFDAGELSDYFADPATFLFTGGEPPAPPTMRRLRTLFARKRLAY